MTKVFDTKSQHGFFCGVPRGLAGLMWYFGRFFGWSDMANSKLTRV